MFPTPGLEDARHRNDRVSPPVERFQFAAEADDVLPARQSFGDESVGYGLKGD
jgi:hypothetical protein